MIVCEVADKCFSPVLPQPAGRTYVWQRSDYSPWGGKDTAMIENRNEVRELNPENLSKVSGGVLTQDSRDYVINYIRSYKGMGETSEILKTATGWSDEMISYALSMWDKVTV